jgi:hypothetical protein
MLSADQERKAEFERSLSASEAKAEPAFAAD